MPEFQRRKRRSLTDEQLYEEYHRTDEPKSKAKSGKSAKTAKTASPAREEPPVSSKRPQKREEQVERMEKRETSPEKKKIPPEKKSPPKDTSRRSARKRRGKMTLYYVLIGIVAVAAVSILSVTVLFNISSFEVVGDTSYSAEEIIAACGIDEGDNLLRINIGQAEESIVSQLVYIDSARISRGFPNRLVIAVEPAQPVLSFASGSRYYTISERGRLLEISGSSADCPVVKGYSPAADAEIGAQLEDDGEGRIAIALQMIEYMREYGLSGNCEINLTDTLNIRMTYEGRVEMELGANTRMEDKFYHAGLLLESEITANERCTLILSNPDRVVKRPIYDSDVDDDGYVVTTPEEEEPPEESEEGENSDGDDGTG